MDTSEQVWGLTPPISVALPTPAEMQATNTLFEELKRQNQFEPASEDAKRKKIIKHLESIGDEFVRRIARKKEPHNQVLIRDARCEIFTYGSYLLGVYGPGSDIDTLVAAPKYVSREDYFEIFPDLIEEMAPKCAITDLTPVEDAFVPIIKFEYWGISIDLIFSRIATLTQFPPHGQLKLTDNSYLRGLDDRELRSLNGNRVTQEILNLVPEKSTFRLALRAIKLWAQRRAIYANIIGFPGGVVWAMLVARVCQLYPKATSATIVSKFFLIIRNWRWPQPVQLKDPDKPPLNLRVWNPKLYKGDSFNIMPVITPAYPQMCATFNITQSAFQIIQRELSRGGEIADRIMAGKSDWKEMFVKHSFFTSDHKYYLAVIATGLSKDAHKIWSGFVESKVRILVGDVERHQSIAIARPFNKGYDRKHKVKSEDEKQSVIDGSFAFLTEEEEVTAVEDEEAAVKIEQDGRSKIQSVEEVPLTDGTITKSENGTPASATGLVKNDEAAASDSLKDTPMNEDKSKDEGEAEPMGPITSETIIYNTTYYVGLELAEGAKSLDLSWQVNNFKHMCCEWEKYKKTPGLFLSIQHVKNTNLPNDVFEAGETKPMRPLKKQAANGASAANMRKRAAPPDGTAPPPKRATNGQTGVAAAG
ncbi:Poly(A) polymerase pla1 [Microdochium trichocladiopsis]|uniref:Poly(A) polymerase n=1 Tax=Microdochium trichocladiopsis TaxID=1682393 RepID=A0A9P9BWZ8_9PEZI|nr:Poly(A) polymerase pla1 [Microdochium trichocladiopsis]KAH7041307.1 Poly(A) polymerase pla1 [Microdochium trichocladiopsis]